MDYVGTTQKGVTNSFFIGAVNLFVNSQISEKFSMLSEINFEAGEDNNIGIDLERMLLTFSENDHFRLSFGRYHTAIGYYNTAYHHGLWFQTATGRPYLFSSRTRMGSCPFTTWAYLSLARFLPANSGCTMWRRLAMAAPHAPPRTLGSRTGLTRIMGSHSTWGSGRSPTASVVCSLALRSITTICYLSSSRAFRSTFPPSMPSTPRLILNG